MAGDQSGCTVTTMVSLLLIGILGFATVPAFMKLLTIEYLSIPVWTAQRISTVSRFQPIY
jgi:hypothetical protein